MQALDEAMKGSEVRRFSWRMVNVRVFLSSRLGLYYVLINFRENFFIIFEIENWFVKIALAILIFMMPKDFCDDSLIEKSFL